MGEQRSSAGEADSWRLPGKEGLVRAAIALFLVILGGSPALAADEKPEASKAERRHGPKYQSHLNSLPIGSFVESVSLEGLSELIVTDTKVAQPQETVTQKIHVINSDDFEQQTVHNRNIAELLQYRPGLFVNVLSRNDANWGSFGGLGPKYNEYLLDGVPIDSFADSMSLDPWAFARVELHEGPASVLYPNYLTMDFAGNETPLAGITNFVLKDLVEAPMTRFLAGAGSYGTVNGRFYHQNNKNNFHYFLGANYEQSRYCDYGTNGSWLKMVNNPEYQKTKLYTKITHLFGREDHAISLFAHHTQHTGDTGRPNKDFTHRYDTINLVYSNRLARSLTIGVKAGYRNYDRRWGEDGASSTPPDLGLREHDGVEQRIIPLEGTLTFQHAGDSLLSAGMDAQLASYKTYSEVSGVKNTGNDVEARSTGLFIQEKYLWGKWVFRAGGRFDHTRHNYDRIGGGVPEVDHASWEKLLWSAGLRYNALSFLTVYANAGSSFVAPSAKSIGGTIQESGAGVAGQDGQLPNPKLKPESGIGSDVGVDIRPSGDLTVGIRGFFNQIDDAIVDNVVHSSPSQTQSVNAGRASSQGIEISCEHSVTTKFEWFANATYTTTDVENPLDPSQNGSEIPFVPDYVVNVGITAQLPLEITASPYLQMIGTYYDSTSKSTRQAFGQYQVLNLKLNASLLRSSTIAINTALDLNNITGIRYEMPWQFEDPGFNFLFSLRLTF